MDEIHDLVMSPEIARMAGLSKSKMDVLRKTPGIGFPKPITNKGNSKQRTYYKRSEIIAWINANDMNIFRTRYRQNPLWRADRNRPEERATLNNELAQRFIRGEFGAKLKY